MPTYLFLFILSFSFRLIEAIPTVVPDNIPCLVQLETQFFTESVVNQALSMYDVRQELWLPINQYLKVKNREVPERMKIRTAFMVPNPIEYPLKRGPTAKILKEVLFELFYEALKAYPTIEGNQNAELIFQYIFLQKFPEYLNCFGPEALSLKPKNLI